jgi:hypothetical protein
MPALTVDTQCFLAASRLVKHIFHDRINHAAQTSLANGNKEPTEATVVSTKTKK